MSYIKQINDQRQATWHAAKALLDHAAGENRELTAVENTEYERYSTELDGLDARLKDLGDTEARNRALEETMRALGGAQRGFVSQADRETDTAFRDSVLNNSRRPIIVDTMDRRSGFQPGIERRDLATTSGSGLVPTSFYDRIITHMVDSAAILSAGATLLQSDTGETIKIPKSTALSTAAIVAEGGTISESDPTLGSTSLTGYKYGFIVQVTQEFARDATFDLLGYLAQEAGQAIGNAFGAHAITGDGSSKPRGITIDTTLGVTGSTAVVGAFTADNLIDLYYSVAAPYARSQAAGWLMRNASLGAVRKLKDSQNRYLFDANVPAGTGASGTLLGRPVYTDPTVAATGLSAKSVVFGDLSKYWVRQVGPFRFERSDEFAFNADLITFRALTTLDGALVDTTGACKHFVGGAS